MCHHFLVWNDVLQHLHPLQRPKTAKIESRPQARHWRSNKTVAEGDRPSAIVEDHSQLEVIAAGLRQLSESLEVTSIHGSASLDFDTDQCATSRFNHKVNLVLIFVPVMVQSAALIKPRRLFQHLRENKCLQQRPEDRTVFHNPLCGGTQECAEQAGIKEKQLGRL